MAIVFKDKDTGQILRIDFGEPDPDTYAGKEGLKNWEAVKMDDAEAKKLLNEGPGVLKPPPKTVDQRISALEAEVFKSQT